MSAKNVGGSRSDELDRYYTPRWAVDQCYTEILPYLLNGSSPSRVLEPSSGGGVFVDASRRAWPSATIHSIDIDPEARADVCADFLSCGSPASESDRYDLAIGNPPYTLALEFVKACLAWADAVVFILRQGFLASQKRSLFLRANPPAGVWLLPNRPSFTEDGRTDSADYCWVTWSRFHEGETELRWLSPTPKAKRAR